jgi:hypothetical protein
VATLDRTALAARYMQAALPLFSLLSPGDAPSSAPPEARPFPATRLSGSVKLLVAQDVPALASQRVVAHLLALGLAVEVQAVARSAVREGSADARLLLWTPDVPDAELSLRELAGLVGAADVDSLCDLASTAAGGARTRALAQAEAALIERHALIPLALSPLILAERPEIHDLRLDAAGGLILEDAWLAP